MPTPQQIVAAWAVGSPATTEPEPRYRIAGVTLPTTTPTTGADLLGTCDPWLAAALPYFQHCLNRALARPYAAAMAGQVLTGTTTAACVETLPVDPAPYLASRGLRLPLLCGYPVSATFAERTMQHERMAVTYRLDYLLHPVTHDQAQRVAPVLQAGAGVLMQAIRRGASASYQSGADVWPDTLVEYVRCTGATFGIFDRADLAHPLPALSLTVEVGCRTFDDDAAGLPFWGGSLTLTADSDGDPLTLVTARTDLP